MTELRSIRPLILLLSSIILVSGCATYTEPVTDLDQQVPHPWSDVRAGAPVTGRREGGPVDAVFVQCAVTQGNGFNWAATLGWLSGEVELAAARAAGYEAANPGRYAAIDLGCMTGSSSGGAATSLFDHLLANPRLVGAYPPAGDGARLVTPHEAREISKALMFLALSADFRTETMALGLTGIGAWLGLLDRRSRDEPVSFWRAVSAPGRNLRIFGRWIRAASLYDPEWWYELVGPEPYSIPTFSQRSAALGHGPDHVADARMRALSTAARRILDERSRGQQVAPEPVGDGFCVTSFAVPLDGEPLPFDQDQLILVVGCNGDTHDRLVEGSALAQLLSGSAQMAQRLRIARANDWYTLLNMTVREPELTTPLSGRLPQPPIGLGDVRVFDGASMVPISEGEAGKPHLIMGGFAGPRLQAWTATVVLMQRMEALSARGFAVDGRIAVFGRTEDRAVPDASFAQRVIVDYFTPFPSTGDAADAAAGLDAFYAWQDEYCEVVAAVTPEVRIDFFRMDWNLTSSPAAMTRRSRELAALGYNLGRVQAEPGAFPELDPVWFRSFLFAPEDAERFVVSPPAGGIACRLQERGV